MRKLLCFFLDHRWPEWSEPYETDDTSAPYPAVGEWQRSRQCLRCGEYETAFAGFIMEAELERK